MEFSKQNPFQGELLQIESLKTLSDVIRDIESDPSLAKGITAIEIKEKELDDSELDANGDPPKIAPEVYEQFGIHMSKIIQSIKQHSILESFTWIGVDDKNMRPAVFWDALCKTSGKMKSLNLEFSVHELRKMSRPVCFHPQMFQFILTLAFYTLQESDFSGLNTLRINAAGAHGDDGSFVEEILQKSHAVQNLDLSLPNCDLEKCRIQGMTWKYTFPSLRSLKLSTYNSDNAALSTFLLRHPEVRVLHWSVDSDDGFVFPHESLPALRELSIEFQGDKEIVKANIEVLAQCSPHLERLEIRRIPNAGYLQVAKLGKSLKYLDLDPGVCTWREGFDEPEQDSDDEWNRRTEAIAAALEAETGTRKLSEIIRRMFGELPGLRELAVDFETANTYVNHGHPDPMDENDLKSMITLFPQDTRIRVLRMSDSRGLGFAPEWLENLTDIPASLEYLKWTTGENMEKESLYRFERSGNQVKAIKWYHGIEPEADVVRLGKTN